MMALTRGSDGSFHVEVSQPVFEQRKRVLTDSDINALADAILEKQFDHCRYSVEPERLEKVVVAMEELIEVFRDSKKTARRAGIIIVVGSIMIATATGFIVMIWEKLKYIKTTITG